MSTPHRTASLDHLFSQADRLSRRQQVAYVKLMFYVISHGLASASQHDARIREELGGCPVGLTIKMQVLPQHASFVVKVNADHTLRVVKQETADVNIYIKHLSMAMLILTFRESTAQAFANDRMTVDGDIAIATRFVRILNQLQALILPKVIAKRAIKRYPELATTAKFNTARKIYWALAKNAL